ncbi:MAG: LysR family transcriptional regulator, partial [Rhodospirillaceae bacterium]|nr:LysR family transcriptional regulator [Rhodospirillaceae bacterium]
GSFTRAGDVLNLSQSAVSRQVSALEESLRIPLFHRHARGLLLTEQGEDLYRTVHDVFAKLAMAEARLTESKVRPEGPFKITTTVAFGAMWLAPRIREFIEAYPEIQVSLVLDDSELDLAMRAADVGIRFKAPHQPDLIQRNLFTMQYRLYAAPSYLSAHGTPQCISDLDAHRLIVYGEDTRPPIDNMNWLLTYQTSSAEGRSPILRVNNVHGILQTVRSGLGIGALPDYFGSEVKDLVRVLPSLEGPSFDSYFVYPQEMRHSKRVAVFRDFLLKMIATNY